MENSAWGLICCFLTAIFMGTSFVPIKRYPPGDGFFNQLLICIGGFGVALVIHFIRGFPEIYPLVMIGGACWATANAFGILIINVLGLGLSVLIWNTSACVIGWSQSRFGWPGLPREDLKGPWLNYIGVFILLCGGVCYLFVKNVKAETKVKYDEDSDVEISIPEKFEDLKTEGSEISSVKRAAGALGAALVGLLYGSTYTPVAYIYSHKSEFTLYNGAVVPSENCLDHIFSYFLGSLTASIIIFLIYALVKKNRPQIHNRVTLSALLSGVINGLSQTCFMISNQQLSQSIAYPICNMLPGLVASLWSVLYFREIKGRKNMLILALAYVSAAIGITCVTISKSGGF